MIFVNNYSNKSYFIYILFIIIFYLYLEVGTLWSMRHESSKLFNRLSFPVYSSLTHAERKCSIEAMIILSSKLILVCRSLENNNPLLRKNISSRYFKRDDRSDNVQNHLPGLDLLTTIRNWEIYLRFSNNSEAFASELIENLRVMFSHWYKHSDILSVSYSITP